MDASTIYLSIYLPIYLPTYIYIYIYIYIKFAFHIPGFRSRTLGFRRRRPFYLPVIHIYICITVDLCIWIYLYLHVSRTICSADGSTHTESNKLYRTVKHRYRPNLSPRQRPTAKARREQAALAASAGAGSHTPSTAYFGISFYIHSVPGLESHAYRFHRWRPFQLSVDGISTHT